jgi:aminoglycoside phosphotransferase (APT) family kinase protein
VEKLGPVDAPALVAAVSKEVTGRWTLEGRLAGGANEGAYLVRGPRDARAVVKALKARPDQLMAAARLVAHARAGGWPTPAWYAVGAVPTGLVPAGGSWILQEFVLGERPATIDPEVADRLVAIIRGQEGLLPPGRPESGAPGGWDQWIAGVLFEDGEGLRSRIRGLPGAERILRDVDAIAEACSGQAVSGSDLVHGDLNLTNTLLTGPGLQVIDVDALAPGPRAFDLAKLIMVSTYMGHATDAGLARLWSYADSYDPHELASCFGSASLKLAEAVIRHRVYDQAPMILSKIGGILGRIRGRLTV